MQKMMWQKWVKDAADPKRAGHFLDLLAATDAGPQLKKFSADQIRILVALFSGSRALGELLVANPGWLPVLEAGRLKFPRRAQGFQREVEGWLKPKLAARDYIGALAELRRFKQREMLRIAARDLARLGNVVEITREISDVADVCLNTVWRICRHQFFEKFGRAVSSGRRRQLAADGILRARHGQARRAGTQLQFRRGRAVSLQR